MRLYQAVICFLLWVGSALAAVADIQVIGHRGAKDIYPENSLPSIEYAITDGGADVIEFDIHMSRDGVIFLNHDPTIPSDRCSFVGESRKPATRVLYELTSIQVAGFDCGSRRDSLGRPKYLAPGAPLPTLEQVLIASQELDPGTVYSIELKYAKNSGQYPPVDDLVTRVQQVLAEFDLEHQIYLQSFSEEVLKALRSVYPREANGIRLVYLYGGEGPGKSPDWNKTAEFIEAQGMDAFSPNFRLMKNDINGFLDHYSKTVRAVPVVPYTLNEEFDWLMAARLFEVDGIITDDPLALREFLAARKQSRSSKIR